MCTYLFANYQSQINSPFFIHADRETVPFAASFKLSLIFCRLSVVWHLGFTPITKIELACQLVSGNVTNNFVEITYQHMLSQTTLKSASGEHSKKKKKSRKQWCDKNVYLTVQNSNDSRQSLRVHVLYLYGRRTGPKLFKRNASNVITHR